MRAPMLLTLAASLWALGGCSNLGAPEPPAREPPEAVRWAKQGLSATTRNWLHHASLGEPALSLPLSWFFALEQPSWWVAEKPLFSDPDYLRRFGFLIDAQDPTGLPVGFAIHEREGEAGAPSAHILGLTCAACHSGELEHDGVSFRFDGGPSRVALDQFERALALAVLQTVYVPGREGRAVTRIAGQTASDEEVERLEQQLERLAAQLEERIELREGLQHAEEGFGRLDLSSRLSNEVFAHQLGVRDARRALTAPVRPAALWDTPWFDSNPYTGAMHAPLALHAAKALTFAARVKPGQGPEAPPDSSLDFEALRQLGAALAGPRPPHAAAGFTGLRAPRWPGDLFGAIDRSAALEGERLYDALCRRCHRPPPNREDFFDETHWTAPDARGQRYLELVRVPLEEIGTDPRHAEALSARTLPLPPGLGEGPDPVSLPEGLRRLVTRLEGLEKAEMPVDPRGGEAPEDGTTTPGYRARPLDGVWATAPYLHNGSVPTLYALLSPLEERPERFSVGRPDFDPEHVGLPVEESPEPPLFDTREPGNHNTGHLFDEGEGPGIVGRRLTPLERAQLVEYLKTLESRRLPVGPDADPPKPGRP